MLRLAADEDFNNDIVRGLRRRMPSIELVRVQDAGHRGSDDATVLLWCAQTGRVLFTHDVTTMTKHAYDRIRASLLMPGVFEVSRKMSVGAAIEEILLIAECSLDGEWEGQVRYLPLQ
jgi:hypothetical protein